MIHRKISLWREVGRGDRGRVRGGSVMLESQSGEDFIRERVHKAWHCGSEPCGHLGEGCRQREPQGGGAWERSMLAGSRNRVVASKG